MIHGHGGVVIGSEMSGGVRNVAISNCVFVGTDRGIRIKARRGRGGGGRGHPRQQHRHGRRAVPARDQPVLRLRRVGRVEGDGQSPQPVTDRTPRFRRLRFSNITARRVKYSAAYVVGLPEMFVEDIALQRHRGLPRPRQHRGRPIGDGAGAAGPLPRGVRAAQRRQRAAAQRSGVRSDRPGGDGEQRPASRRSSTCRRRRWSTASS